jgi:hypothetical protein
MATGFTPDGASLIPFAVDVRSSIELPLPVFDDGGGSWEAVVRIDSASNVTALRNERTKVTRCPAIGMGDTGGTIVLEKVTARFGDLTIPDTDGGEQTWRAALEAIAVTALIRGGVRWCSVRFAVGDRVS